MLKCYEIHFISIAYDGQLLSGILSSACSTTIQEPFNSNRQSFLSHFPTQFCMNFSSHMPHCPTGL